MNAQAAKATISGIVLLGCCYVFASTIGVTAYQSYSGFKASEAKYKAAHQMPKLSEAELAPMVCPNYFKYEHADIEPIQKIRTTQTFCENYRQFAGH